MLTPSILKSTRIDHRRLSPEEEKKKGNTLRRSDDELQIHASSSSSSSSSLPSWWQFWKSKKAHTSVHRERDASTTTTRSISTNNDDSDPKPLPFDSSSVMSRVNKERLQVLLDDVKNRSMDKRYEMSLRYTHSALVHNNSSP